MSTWHGGVYIRERTGFMKNWLVEEKDFQKKYLRKY